MLLVIGKREGLISTTFAVPRAILRVSKPNLEVKVCKSNYCRRIKKFRVSHRLKTNSRPACLKVKTKINK